MDEYPRAAFLTTVGNNSVQYKYTVTKTIKLATTPILAKITDPTPSGIIAKTNRQNAQIKLKTITIVFLPIIFNNGIADSVPNRVTLALAATLMNALPLS